MRINDTIIPGLYKHSTSGLITIWDMRIRRPNSGMYLTPDVIHTIEHTLKDHLFYRYGKYRIVGVFPMGCQTGFYVLTRFMNKYQIHEAISDYASLLQMKISIPGANQVQCSQYKLHDLKGAKYEMLDYLQDVLHQSNSATNYNINN